MTASAQIAGNTSANIAEVEAATKALRVTLRPEDYSTLGIYSLSQASGTMALGLGAGSRIFSFRWPDATRLALIKRVTFSAGCIAAFTTPGSFIFNMFRVVSFTVGDTTGRTDITPATGKNKLRTSMGDSLLVGVTNSVAIATTAAISGGTLTTPDTNPLGTLVGGIPNLAGTQIVAPSPLFETRPGEHPLLLAQNEGFMIQSTVPTAAGTWQFGVKVDWTEIAAY